MNWKEVPAPGRKPEYIGKFILLKENMPSQRNPSFHSLDRGPTEFLPPAGSVVKIYSRLNALSTQQSCRDVAHWGNVRILTVDWTCPHCEAVHRYSLPESWLAEGRAVFVEPGSEPGEAQPCR